MSSTVPAAAHTPDRPSSDSVFDGLVVLDAATLVAGPLISTYLAEFGADVIKIEQPVGGDPIRAWGSMKGDVNLMWKSLGRNKRSATLDLRSPEGRELFRRMAQKADVVVLNTRPSTLERWGLDHPRLAALNPRLIVVHVTGYGAGGPYSDRPGFGTIGEAMSGFAHVTGEPSGSPTLPGIMLADCVAGVNGAFAVAAALLARHRTGRGQLVDLSLVEPLARFVEQATLTYDQLGTIPAREGNRWSISVPRNTYRTSDDRWIALSGSSPTIALRVYDAIGRPELKDDPDYADPHRRIVNRDAVDGLIAGWVAARPLAEVLGTFEGAGVAAGPVYDAAQLMDDPHLRARGTFVTVTDDELGDVRVQAPVARLSDTPGTVRHLGPALGADNETVYRDLLGLTGDELAGLRRSGVV
ncbi:CaiB/BaiF CoA transferase family protein [Pseudonocardia parietis]|uniref:Crotonobetainyl-CoA:carnitine CoA-transferase CaiB-like acyl-CoA transferase n=1 Tax=Pseudonocardia parietis TaxID=570936 RepID=A0ABS4VUQ3_9PSEU|nr:CoA transferase [Pseudonocardia parietis]MBP2367650.1 crotonobetainyl-CoA:carnitine CoA-transferase CaiB-like acyl-CoA transferase [Pseudonocardia parietis]